VAKISLTHKRRLNILQPQKGSSYQFNVFEGSLTRPEAERLRTERRRIESDMKRAGQDGISLDEMTRFDQELSQLRRDISRERQRYARASLSAILLGAASQAADWFCG